jgi:hypothetical protein
MGIRGELFSSRVGCEGRTYFFNVKENRMGDMFLTVVESKPSETEGFERRSVVIFREDLPDFVKALQGALDFMAKDEGKKPSVDYAPAAAAAPRRARTPGGFAGNEPEGSARSAADSPKDGAPAKRRIVVRRKKTD